MALAALTPKVDDVEMFKRKGWLIAIVLGLVGAAYLGAQALSSSLFERELRHAIAELENEGGYQVERDEIQHGWFVSRGRIRLSPEGRDDWRASIPYTARHGVLSTQAEGDVDIALGTDRERLFGDHLPVAPPRWNANYASLSGEFDSRFSLAPFTMEDKEQGWRLETQGVEWDIYGQRGDVSLVGSVAPWTLEDDIGRLEVGKLEFDSRYRHDEETDDVEQQDEIRLSRLAYRGPLIPDISIERWRYQSNWQLDDEQGRLAVDLSLDDARMGDQSMIGGGVAIALSRLNADATRQTAALIREVAERGEHWDAAERRRLLERLEPKVQAMLADSPKLTLDTVDLNSAMLDMLVDIEGELVFDGDDVESLSLTDWEGHDVPADWRARLDGHITWRNVPTLLLFQLGLSPDIDDLEIDIDAGEISLNGRPVPW